jgi:acyl carrier protein
MESAATPTRSAAEIRRWIVERLSTLLNMDPAEIRTDEPLIDVGLDSMDFVGLVVDLENWLGCRFKDNPLIDYPTADALSEYLAGQLARGRTAIDPTVPD